MHRQLILGTAGHIDHGKTSLVRTLTGVDTDRLPQEKQRGITIDIGFARLDLGDTALGVVDVPGHERFVKNMLAGAAGVDIAMLVVAADDSVMPQTKEHLAILQLLLVRHGVIALTKTDLADPDWVEMVEQDVRELVKGTFLEDAPIVRTSATTGAGIDELKNTLSSMVERISVESDANRGLFRMPIDRTFSLQGLGAVVTGTVASGEVRVEDELLWWPIGKTVRVRSAQSHGVASDCVGKGQRAALNISGAKHTEFKRGHELAAPGYLEPSRCITVRLRVLAGSPWPVRNRSRVRLYVGTQEVMASVRLFGSNELAPGEEAYVQLFCAEPTTAVARQPFVLRSESPLVTIGGGRIVRPVARPVSRRNGLDEASLATLLEGDAKSRCAVAIRNAGHMPWTIAGLCRDADVSPEAAVSNVAALEADGEVVTLPIGGSRSLRMHTDHLSVLHDAIRGELAKLHKASPLEAAVPVQRLLQKLSYIDADTVSGALREGIGRKAYDGDEQNVLLPDFKPDLSQRQIGLCRSIIAAHQEAFCSPPSTAALGQTLNASPKEMRSMCELCMGQGAIVHIGGGTHLHAEVEREARRRIEVFLQDNEGMTISQMREMLETTRKYAVPLAEYFDKSGFTKRKGDVRVLVNPPSADVQDVAQESA